MMIHGGVRTLREVEKEKRWNASRRNEKGQIEAKVKQYEIMEGRMEEGMEKGKKIGSWVEKCRKK